MQRKGRNVFAATGKEWNAKASRAKRHLWPWKVSGCVLRSDEIFMQLAKSQEEMSLKKFVVCSIASLCLFPPFLLFFKLKFPLRGITSLHQTPFSSCIYSTHSSSREATDYYCCSLETSFTREESPTFSFKFSKWHYRWIFRWVSTDTASLLAKKTQLLWSVCVCPLMSIMR